MGAALLPLKENPAYDPEALPRREKRGSRQKLYTY
jgi:hypothetical protein